MNKIFLKTVLIVFLSSLMWSCSDSKDEIDEAFTNESHLISGKVEKGPMVQGSTIEMRTLNKDMTATGQSYTTTIENNNGNFNYGTLKLNSPYAKLTADGYFFNEVSGDLSNSTISLDAIVDLTDNTSVNVNVITHLKSQRILTLIDSGKSFEEANEQAQEELLKEFGLQQYANVDATQYSISSGNDYAGALIAISSYILSDRSEAQIVEYLSKLTNEFKTGSFSDDTKEKLLSTKYYLNGQLDNIQDNIVNRYDELGYDVSVKDLEYYFDWDDDGIAGNEIDGSTSVKLSQNQIDVPAEGGNYTITISSNLKYYLEAPFETTSADVNLDTENDNVSIGTTYSSELYEAGYKTTEIDYDNSIDGNTITIIVKPAQFKKEKTAHFYVYNVRGANVGSITITQEGDTNATEQIPNLGEMGEYVVNAYANSLYQAVNNAYILEKNYLEDKCAISTTDSELYESYQYFYQCVNNMIYIKEADESQGDFYQDFCNTHIAMVYLSLSSLWGGVPYFTSSSNYSSMSDLYLSRTSEEELLSQLANSVNNLLPYLDDKRNESLTDANKFLFVSKDVARIVLAQIYCQQQQYDAAKELLDEVVSNGYYNLEQSENGYANNSESIFGLESDGDFVPYIDYKDVLLTLAECEYHTGSTTIARDRVNEVAQCKNISLTETDVLNMIAQTRIMLDVPNSIVFLRRNSLGSYIGLNSDTEYQLLWPIPQYEMDVNPSMTQNPGY